MTIYRYRRGNGNEGNFHRCYVNIPEGTCPYKALLALVANDYILGKTRRHIEKGAQIDGESQYCLYLTVYEGPDGETDFGAAWLTAELTPSPGENNYYELANLLDDQAKGLLA